MDADVLVVGAGFAGLAAAARLHEAGRHVRVLEARDHIGGRVRTVRDPRAPVPVELGAEFVHGAAPRSRALLEEAGVATVSMSGEALRGENGKVGPADAAWRGIGRVLGALRPDRTPDRSFAEFLRVDGDRLPSDAVVAASAFVEGFYAADVERISERSLALEGIGAAADSDRIPRGYEVLTRHLADKVPSERVLLNRIVKRVAWRDGHVEVQAARGDGGAETLSAAAIVITVPLGVLKAPESLAGIAFEPQVPGLGGALSGLESGSAVRVTLAFTRSLWQRPALIPVVEEDGSPPSFIQTPTRDFNAFWTVEPSQAPVLVAWSGGARSRRLTGTEDDLARHALDDLSSAVGADRLGLAKALAGAWMHDWRSDPFSLGAYSYIAVGGMNASAHMARPVEHTVFFAGEATCAESIGTVEGALESGERAARNVLLALK